MVLTPGSVRHNDMSKNLGTDFIAVDDHGNILGRANTHAAAHRAVPDAAAFFTGADFKGVSADQIASQAAQPNDALAAVVAQVDPGLMEDYAPKTEPEITETKPKASRRRKPA